MLRNEQGVFKDCSKNRHLVENRLQMKNRIGIIQSRIFDSSRLAQLDTLLQAWRHNGKKLVFTNGCFDLIHKGHLEYLSKAAELGDILIIGLNSDESVKRLKGPGRPLHDMETRATLLASLLYVDAVIVFEEDTPIGLIERIQPDVLVKGGDYSPETIVGYDLVMKKNGKVIAMDLVEGFSTSNLIKKIQGSDGK